MARMIPSVIYPNCGSPGEHEIFRKLQNDPATRDWIVLHSLDITEHNTQIVGEADFVVVVPEKGVLCVEVKSHREVRRDAANGLWHLGKKVEARGPFKQASDAMYSLRQALLSQHPELSRVVFWSAVVFPYSEFSTISPEWHPWQVIDKYLFRQEPIGQLFERILEQARGFLRAHSSAAPWFHPERKEPTIKQCGDIAEALRPSFEYINSFRSQRETLKSELLYYTEEQYEALDTMDAEPRVSFEGPAGTGKTVLALEAARRARASGRKVLLVCFNRLLGKWIEEEAQELQPEVVTKTLHRHMLDVSGWDLEKENQLDSSFWRDDLPVAASESLLDGTGDQFIFDEIIVDEAQDIISNENYLDFLEFSLRGGWAEGLWTLFGDYDKQAIFGGSGIKPKDVLEKRGFPPAAFFTYLLTKNCRNTPRIAEAVRILGRLNPGYKKILRPDNGVEPDYIFYKSEKDQLSWLANVLDGLFADGFRAEDVVLLSKKADDACAASKLNPAPWKGRLKPFHSATKGQIPYGSIYSFKGLEAPVVILTDFDSINTTEDQNLCYVGMTRAVNKLVILAQVQVKNELIQLITNVKAPGS